MAKRIREKDIAERQSGKKRRTSETLVEEFKVDVMLRPHMREVSKIC